MVVCCSLNIVGKATVKPQYFQSEMEKANGRLAILVFYVILAGAASPAASPAAPPAAPPAASQRFTIRGAVASAESRTFVLPLANVSLIGPNAANCTPLSLLTSRLGTFEFSCAGGAPKSLSMIVWARQYTPRTLTLSKFDFLHVALAPRPIPGFPGKLWRFDGWAVEAETGDVPGTNISFLSHPSAFRTPSGRIFLISTAGSTTGQKPGWTQGYWQSEDGVRAVACKGPKGLVTSFYSHTPLFKSRSQKGEFGDLFPAPTFNEVARKSLES